jgi:hypothetical protein
VRRLEGEAFQTTDTGLMIGLSGAISSSTLLLPYKRLSLIWSQTVRPLQQGDSALLQKVECKLLDE